MRIRNRINSTFTVFFAITTIVLCGTIYLLSSSSRSDLFNSQLQERLNISENFFLESENREDAWLNEMRAKFLRKLPSEIEYYGELDGFHHQTPDSILQRLPADFEEQLSSEEYTYWTFGKQQGAAKIFSPNDTEYVVLVIAEDTYGLLYMSKLKILLISALLITIALTYFLSFYFSRNVLKPIASKITKANRISAQNLNLRLTVYNEKDELGMLAQSFNSLLDRLQESFELQKNFVRYASHEMKNPLAVMIGEAEVALSQARTSNEYMLTIEKLKNSAEKLNELVNHFLNLSRFENVTLDAAPVNLDELVMESIIQISASRQSSTQIDFIVDEDLSQKDFLVSADKALLSNVIYNILDNAVKFSPDDSAVDVMLMRSERKNKLELRVQDQGKGIPKQDLKRIFEPLYRAANAFDEPGSGIGLSLVHKIVQLHNFRIRIESELDKGTTVIITF